MKTVKTRGPAWADVFETSSGSWTAIVGGKRVGANRKVETFEIERKTGMTSEHNAITAMEAMWRRHYEPGLEIET